MQHVSVTLQFLTPCLGQVRCNDYDRFNRDTHGCVIFMNSWWHQVLEFGAQAFGKHQRLVRDIKVHPRIGGRVGKFRRYYGQRGYYKDHEAFLPGTPVTLSAILPAGLPKKEFLELLTIAGEYRGISPYGWRDGYGRFEVEKEAANDTDAT